MKNISKPYNLLLLFAILLAVIGIISPFIPKIFLDKHQLSDLALIGDWWGGTSAVFIAIAGIILLILNYLSQKEELELTRNELAFTRREFKQQNETLIIQRFENTFFNLLSLHNQIIDSIEEFMDGRTYKKRDYFEYVYNHLSKNYVKDSIVIAHRTNNEELELQFHSEQIKRIYKKFVKTNYWGVASYQSVLGHYFRNLYHLVKFIDDSAEITENKKKFYGEIVRAQLSSAELGMLFYNSLSHYATGNTFKNLIEKYKLLINFEVNLLILPIHERYYEHFYNWNHRKD